MGEFLKNLIKLTNDSLVVIPQGVDHILTLKGKVTLPRQSKVESGQTYEFIKYENGDIMLHPKKKNDNFWKSLSARYTDSEIKRLDERDKALFNVDAVQAKGAERWWEND